MLDVLEPWAMSVLDVENLRLHYAETFRQWLARFETAPDTVADMFDRRSSAPGARPGGSAAAFTAGTLQLFQVLFARHAVNSIPWTRGRLEGECSSPYAPRGNALSGRSASFPKTSRRQGAEESPRRSKVKLPCAYRRSKLNPVGRRGFPWIAPFTHLFPLVAVPCDKLPWRKNDALT